MKTYIFHSKPIKNTRYTVAGVLSEDGKTLSIGVAINNSKKDQFLRKRGRDIALGRAQKHPSTKISIKESVKVGEQFNKFAEKINVQEQIEFYTKEIDDFFFKRKFKI